jgi:hypothetical protein
MLMPMAGKKPAKESAAKKPTTGQRRKSVKPARRSRFPATWADEPANYCQKLK